ncbi:MAG TPA: hypothetical protein VFJ97_12090 [Dermatophilaceae bacterium]|nr:hypothetical protein [Dermatophilaceae bacterium]
MAADVTDRLYRAFDPMHPLGAHEKNLYVDWQREVGIEDVKSTLVNAFVRGGDQNVWRLFSGHSGVGKTTELLRVGERLGEGVRGRRFFVSTLRGEQWLDLDDIRAEDVAFQLIRQLATDLVNRGGMSFKAEEVRGWGSRIVEWLGKAELSVGADWLGLSFTLKDFPGQRDEFRDLLRGQLPSLFDNVNEKLLRPAREHLARQGYSGGIVAIVDDLDKIPVRVIREGAALTNHEQLFVHEGRLLRSLRCDVLYTIPIELAYSKAQNELTNQFGARVLNLPVIALRDQDGQPQPAGLKVLRKIYDLRVAAATTREPVFAEPRLVDEALASTGGHVRSLFVLMRELLDQVDQLPISAEVLTRVLRRLRRDMHRGLTPHERALLDQVAGDGREVDDEGFFGLLRSGYLLAYLDDGTDWYAPHPWLGTLDPP